MTETTATARTATSAATVSATTDTDTDDTKKVIKEIPVIHDQGFFQHDTGDIYDGFFEAKKKDLSVKMHGPGVYTTAEGDSYKGTWELDKFGGADEGNIQFVDGSKYEGLIKDWCYHGKGKYTYPDGSVLKGEFSANCPVGNLQLTDPNGHTWLGKADQGFGWFEPVNHFYEFLETTRNQNRIKRRHRSNPDQAAISPSKTKTVSKK